MTYTNPPVPHDVNVSSGGFMLDFIKNFLMLIGIIIIFIVVIFLGTRYLAKYIPFRYEKELAKSILTKNILTGDQLVKQDYLENLSTKLVQTMALPDDMNIEMHLLSLPDFRKLTSNENDNGLNAFTMIGGNIYISEVLLCVLNSENGLSMIIAHEIAHVKHRDVISHLGANVISRLTLALILGSDITLLGNQISVDLMSGQFSQRQEHAADLFALNSLKQHYGHTFGADDFFKQISSDQESDKIVSTWFSSHPNTKDRIDKIESYTRKNYPKNKTNPVLVAIPDFVKKNCK